MVYGMDRVQGAINNVAAINLELHKQNQKLNELMRVLDGDLSVVGAQGLIATLKTNISALNIKAMQLKQEACQIYQNICAERIANNANRITEIKNILTTKGDDKNNTLANEMKFLQNDNKAAQADAAKGNDIVNTMLTESMKSKLDQK